MLKNIIFPKGHAVSDETREKIRIQSTGRKHSPETIAKCKAASPKGWKHTPEAKLKISEAARRRAQIRNGKLSMEDK